MKLTYRTFVEGASLIVIGVVLGLLTSALHGDLLILDEIVTTVALLAGAMLMMAGMWGA